MRQLRLPAICAALLALVAMPARAGTEQVIHQFQGAPDDGKYPRSELVAIGGVLYGTTLMGGTSDRGTVYSVTPRGVTHVLHSFAGGEDGYEPGAGLTVVGRALYGVTFSDESGPGRATGFAFSTSIYGDEQTFGRFTTRDGNGFGSPLVRLRGALYGLAQGGGIGGAKSKGTLYKLGFAGTARPIYTFTGGADGLTPFGRLLVQPDGFYGATYYGGVTGGGGNGTLFRITPDGQKALLHVFTGIDGAHPNGSLVARGSAFYGTTQGDYGLHTNGTVFKLTPDGTLTTLHAFAEGSDGIEPVGGLAELNGTLYGVTRRGGSADGGTIFTVAPDDTVQQVYAFPSCSQGMDCNPEAGLVSLNGSLYGTTTTGGVTSLGTVYRYRP